jgi:hypothetical protein
MDTTLINDIQWHQHCVLYAEREIRFQQAKLAEAQAKLAAVENAIKKKAESPFFKCVNPQCPRSAECWTFNRPQVDPKRRLDFQFEIDSEGEFHCDQYEQF